MKEKIKHLYANKGMRYFIYAVGVLLVLSITFQAGIFVGYHKANFARGWGENYEKNFGMHKPGSFKGMMRGDRLPSAHGVSGKVLSVSLPNFVVEDLDGIEKSVTIKNDTIIKQAMEKISSENIKAGSYVVVLGDPSDNGQIDAKLVRVMASSTRMYDGKRGMMIFER